MSAQAAPPAKLEHPKAKVEAEAVNAKQWGTKTLTKPAVNHPSTGTGAQAWLEGNQRGKPQSHGLHYLQIDRLHGGIGQGSALETSGGSRHPGTTAGEAPPP